MSCKDSESDPLWIWFINTNHNGQTGQIATTLGIGKTQMDAQFAGPWCRNLETDLMQIKLLDKYISSKGKKVILKGDSWNEESITTIISILERDELQELHIEELEHRFVESQGFEWIWIQSWPDACAPRTEEFLEHWLRIKDRIIETIQSGNNVLVHCKGGLGRTCALSALILNELGSPIEQAIIKVRDVRRNSNEGIIPIEYCQEMWLLRNFS